MSVRLWRASSRARVGDYRIIVDLQDHKLIVQELRIGHRRYIYQ